MHGKSEKYAHFICVMENFCSVKLCEMTEEFRTSPGVVVLHQLDADRHIELLMAFISLNLYTKFDLGLSTCFLDALKTKFLTCRFPPQTIIINSFLY